MMADNEGLSSDSSMKLDPSLAVSASESSKITKTDMKVEKHSPEAKEDENKVGSVSFKLFGVVINASCAQSDETIKPDNTQKAEKISIGFDRKRKLPSCFGDIDVSLSDGGTSTITTKSSRKENTGKEAVDNASMVITVAWKDSSSSSSTSRKGKDFEISTMVKMMAAKTQNLQQQRRWDASRRHNLQESHDGLWNIQKTLTQCDVDQSCRLLIGKQLIDKYVLPFMTDAQAASVQTKEGVAVQVLDVDTNTIHQLVLKQWKTGSFVLTSSWTKDFVKKRNLKVNDKIGLYWDANNSRFNFRVIKRSDHQGEASSSANHNSCKDK